jgi:ubiquinone/menaquinone biosynthesis C-methylase UbiE
MEENRAPQCGPLGEQYSHGYGAASEYMARKSAQTHAAHLMPYLRSGMSLLDCGCGPGAITVGLARVVDPGQVVGIDIEPSQVGKAKSHAATLQVRNVRFEVSSVYELPFPDSSFDVAFAHTVLQHLQDPVRALVEMRRVLRPGGVVALREEDWGSQLDYPAVPLVAQLYDLYLRYWRANGGDPYLPRRYREVLRQAGFRDIRVGGSAEVFADGNALRVWVEMVVSHLQEPVFIGQVTQRGWADAEVVKEMREALKSWGKNPDAFRAIITGEAIGWRP